MNNHIVEENALVSYFYWKGDWIDDLKSIIYLCFQENRYSAGVAWEKTKEAWSSGGFGKLLSLFWIFTALNIWFSMVWLVPAFAVLITSITCIFVTIVTLVAFELNIVERCYLRLFRMQVICPSCHRGPHHHVPEYECPTCGARQHSLLPTAKYGAFYRVCSQCGTHLPTSRFFGRHTLPAFCPHPECGVSFDKDIESRVFLNVAFIGAQRVGKTSLLMGLVSDFSQQRMAADGWDVAYPSPADQEKIQHLCLDLSHGVRQASTRGDVRALSMDLSKTGSRVHRLCFYDPPGEVFRDAEIVAAQNYFRYMKVALFVIDPFAIPEVAALKQRCFAEEEMNVADTPPDESFARWHIALEQSMTVDMSAVACAIVINKTDSPGLQKHTQLHPGASAEVCEQFLTEYGLGNMLAEFSNTFGELGFFAIAAHPESESEAHPSSDEKPQSVPTRPVEPQGVAPLAAWVTHKLGLSHS